MKHVLAYLLACITALHASAASITCTFTAADNTALESYSNGAEATWSKNTGFASGNILISDSNRAHTDTTNTSFYYVNNFTPATYNYDVEATVHFKSVPTSNSTYFGVGGRMPSTSTTGGYAAWLVKGGGGWYLSLVRAGQSTIQNSSVITTPTAGVDYQIKLEMRDHTLRIWWGGAVVLTKHIDTAGSDWLSGVGYPFLWMDGLTSFLSDSTGIHVDNYTVTDAPAVSTTGTLAVSNANLWCNGYDGTGNPRQSSGAEWRFQTNAQVIKITGTTDIEDDFPSDGNLALFVDNVPVGNGVAFTANGTRTDTFYLSTTLGATKNVRVVSSLQAYPTDESYPQGSYIDSIECLDWFTTVSYTLTAPTNDAKLVVYGDSISVGAFASSPNRAGWPGLLKTLYGKHVVNEGWGFRQLIDDAQTSGARQTMAERFASYNPQYIWMAIGTNDYGMVRSPNWSAANFGTAYADLLDKIHAESPNTIIFCQSPLQRTTETANGMGSTLGDYRSQISTAAAARTAYCVYVEGASEAIVPTSELGDGLHPNTAGHYRYMEKVRHTIWKTKPTGAGATTVGATGTTIIK